MHIKMIAATMIAALLWAGGSYMVPAAAQPNVVDPISTEATLPPVAYTVRDAESTALAHAGFTADQVTRLHTEVDYENGIKEFEVEFRSGDWEYDYTVSAETLEILRHQKEYDPPKQVPPAETQPVVTEPPAPKTVEQTEKPAETVPAQTKPTDTKPAETKKISAAEAKSIALSHAGLTEAQVKGLRAEYDRDDGRPEYDVEFRVGRTEYEYEIHAETGKILSWDKEIDD